MRSLPGRRGLTNNGTVPLRGAKALKTGTLEVSR